jgi:ribonuclease VapC
MIVVDSSALLAIIFKEPGYQIFEDIVTGKRCVISAVNIHETATILRARVGADAVEQLWEYIAKVEGKIVPFDEPQVRAAAVAFNRYGKGIDPKARLNLCDCAAYALAKTINAPLLFKGEDFAHTDIRNALDQ